MKFEEALTLMREGKNITHASLGDNVYFQACRLRFISDETTPLEESPISIVKMLGDRQHPDMCADIFQARCKHGLYPQLNLLLIMSDDWQIYIDKVNQENQNEWQD